jgi:hypothetical protein
MLFELTGNRLTEICVYAIALSYTKRSTLLPNVRKMSDHDDARWPAGLTTESAPRATLKGK